MMIPRRDASFEFSEGEMASSRRQSLKAWLQDLERYFKNIPAMEEIDKIIDQDVVDKSSSNIRKLPLVKLILGEKHLCLELMKNIKEFLLERLSKNSPVNNSTDNWDSISKDFHLENYVNFCYFLVRLIDVDYEHFYEFSFTAGRMYIVLLASPGAKRCNVFESSIILSYFKLFDHMEKTDTIKTLQELNFKQVQFQAMLQELKIVFNLVTLSDQEEVKKFYIDTIAKILKYNAIQGYKNIYAFDITMACYQLLDSLCTTLHDTEIEDTIFLIFQRTFELHLLSQKVPKFRIPENQRHGDSIVDFFIYLLDSFTEQTKNVLIRFIKSFISNPDMYQKKDLPVLLNKAVKYELTIFSKFDDLSVVDYSLEVAYAEEVRQRSRAIEFLSKILTVDSSVKQNDNCQATISDHREFKVLEILVVKITDKNDTVKLKALKGLQNAFLEGNNHTRRILEASFDMNVDEKDYLAKRLSKETKVRLKFNLIHLAQNNKFHFVRKSSLHILEEIGKLDVTLLQDEDLTRLMLTLPDDSSILVRTQSIEMLSNWLNQYPFNRNLLVVWVDVILSLLEDDNITISNAATKCLITNVFSKIVSYEDSVSYTSYTPWIIIKVIIEKDKRDVLMKAIQNYTKTELFSALNMRTMENHIYSSKCTEGFVLLSVISGKVHSKNPNTLIKIFLELASETYLDPVKLKLILEVVVDWIKDFSEGSLRQLFLCLSKMIDDGTANLSLIMNIFVVCKAALQRFQMPVEPWIKQRNEISKSYLLNNMNGFRSTCDESFVNYVMIYSETLTDMLDPPDDQLLKMFVDYLKDTALGKCQISIRDDGVRKINLIVTVLARFALRDSAIAREITPHLGMLLRKQLQISNVITIMQSLNDICIKHVSLVEPVLREMVFKLTSSNDAVRICALETLYQLITQSLIRLHGRVLLHILACVVDPVEEIQLKAVAAILNHSNDVNPNILYTSFLESAIIFNECNDYNNFALFPPTELDRTKILYGPKKEEQRIKLYHFMANNIHIINEFQLLMLFKYVINLNTKLEKGKLTHSANGVQAMKDLLKIFVIICQKQQESKNDMEKSGEMNEDDDDLGDEMMISKPREASTSKKNQFTMKDATIVIETMIQVFPHFLTNIISFDPSLTAGVQEFGFAIAKSFKCLVQYAKPLGFWNKYKEKSVSKPEKSKKHKATTSKNNSRRIDDSEEEDSD